jgi:hypothetical protein
MATIIIHCRFVVSMKYIRTSARIFPPHSSVSPCSHYLLRSLSNTHFCSQSDLLVSDSPQVPARMGSPSSEDTAWSHPNPSPFTSVCFLCATLYERIRKP